MLQDAAMNQNTSLHLMQLRQYKLLQVLRWIKTHDKHPRFNDEKVKDWATELTYPGSA